MKIELEVKILDINIDEMKGKLESIGGTYKSSKVMRRYVYDFNPPRAWAWIRLRDNGKTVTITIKEILNDEIDGTKELEVAVDSFDTTHQILEKLWYTPKAYQENRRTSYAFDWVDIEIDERPLIPPYLEIEWQSVEAIESVIAKLWYKMDDTTSNNTKKIYQQYGIELESIKNLSFDN